VNRWKFRAIFGCSLTVCMVASVAALPSHPDATTRFVFGLLQPLCNALLLAGIVYGVNRLICRVRK
jgi:hypothetical protein